MSRDASLGLYLPNIQRMAKRHCKVKKKFNYNNVLKKKNQFFHKIDTLLYKIRRDQVQY